MRHLLPGNHSLDITRTDGLARTGIVEKDPSELVGELYAFLWRRAETETKPIMKAQSEFLARAMTNKDIADVMYETFVHRPRLQPVYVANLAYRASNLVLKRCVPEYPHDKDRSNPEAWNEVAKWVEKDAEKKGFNSLDIILGKADDKRTDNLVDFSLNMGRDITTTQERRGIPLIAAMQLCTDKQEFDFWDVGCSQGHIDIQAARQHEPEYGYREVRVVRLGERVVEKIVGHNIAARMAASKLLKGVLAFPIHDTRHHVRFNQLVQKSRIVVSRAVGIDILNLDDPAVQEWTRISSHYTDDLTDESLAEHEAFQAFRPKNVHFYNWINIASPLKKNKSLKEAFTREGRKDAAYYSFVLHQLKDDEERKIAIQNGMDITKDDGWLFVLDAVDILKDGTMSFTDNRKPYGVSFWAYDKSHPELGWQKLFTMDSGRVKKMQLEKSARKLLRAKYPLRLTRILKS